jgi:hypothetical protein
VVAQSGSVFAWGARGRWFESSPPDKEKSQGLPRGFFVLQHASHACKWGKMKKP